jgi:hypothetical protein
VASNFFNHNVSVFPGNGDGTYQPTRDYNVGQASVAVTVGDFTGNGILGLAVAKAANNTVSVLLGNGDGTFRPAVHYLVGTGPSGVAAGLFTGDGSLSLAVSNSASGNVSVLLNRNDGLAPRPGEGAGQPQPAPAASSHPSGRDLARGHRGGAAPRGADPGVIQMLTPVREAIPIEEITNQPPANAMPKGAPLETMAPLPAEGTVQQATDAVFADRHRTQTAIPSAAWEGDGLELGLWLATLPSP